MAAEYRTGGVEEIHYSDDGTVDSWTQASGTITRAENLPPTSIEQEHTTGNYQSGENGAPTIYLNDFEDYATVKALNRVKKYVALVFKDGVILKTTDPVFMKALLVPKAKRNEGDAEWSISWNEDGDTAFTKIAALTS